MCKVTLSSKAPFILINSGKQQFFVSHSPEEIMGFRLFRNYFESGVYNISSMQSDIKDLQNCGFRLVDSLHSLKVTLFYFKESGKYYGSGEFLVDSKEAISRPSVSWLNIVEDVQVMVDTKTLPGLVEGAQFTTVINCPDHPGFFPVMFPVKGE